MKSAAVAESKLPAVPFDRLPSLARAGLFPRWCTTCGGMGKRRSLFSFLPSVVWSCRICRENGRPVFRELEKSLPSSWNTLEELNEIREQREPWWTDPRQLRIPNLIADHACRVREERRRVIFGGQFYFYPLLQTDAQNAFFARFEIYDPKHRQAFGKIISVWKAKAAELRAAFVEGLVKTYPKDEAVIRDAESFVNLRIYNGAFARYQECLAEFRASADWKKHESQIQAAFAQFCQEWVEPTRFYPLLGSLAHARRVQIPEEIFGLQFPPVRQCMRMFPRYTFF